MTIVATPPGSVLLVLGAAALGAACRGPRPIHELFPEQRRLAGAPESFGQGPVALAADGRRLRLRFDRPVTMAVLWLGPPRVEVLAVRRMAAGEAELKLPSRGRWVSSDVRGPDVPNPRYDRECRGPPLATATAEASRQAACALIPMTVPQYRGTRHRFVDGHDVVVIVVTDARLGRTQVRRAVDRLLPSVATVETTVPARLGLADGGWATYAVSR